MLLLGIWGKYGTIYEAFERILTLNAYYLSETCNSLTLFFIFLAISTILLTIMKYRRKTMIFATYLDVELIEVNIVV